VVAAYVTEYVSGALTAGDETLEARVFGFNETHAGILNSEVARESFLRLLDTVAPPHKEH
jgi:hypothetical protein